MAKIRKKTLANRLTALETYPKSENWGATVEKFKELEAGAATGRQQINALLARIESLERQFRELSWSEPEPKTVTPHTKKILQRGKNSRTR